MLKIRAKWLLLFRLRWPHSSSISPVAGITIVLTSLFEAPFNIFSSQRLVIGRTNNLICSRAPWTGHPWHNG